nr:hypothetical protein [Marinobacterium rhizophilum]
MRTPWAERETYRLYGETAERLLNGQVEVLFEEQRPRVGNFQSAARQPVRPIAE